MSFNEMDILLFQRFFSPKTDSKFVFDMIQINFNKNINKCNDKKVMNIKFNLEYIIKNYLQYQIKQKIRIYYQKLFTIPNKTKNNFKKKA